jgi:hypothetical protein
MQVFQLQRGQMTLMTLQEAKHHALINQILKRPPIFFNGQTRTLAGTVTARLCSALFAKGDPFYFHRIDLSP